MMHPIDLSDNRSRESNAAATGSGWWAILALVIVVALLVTAVIALSGDDVSETPVSPQPTEAPIDPGG